MVLNNNTMNGWASMISSVFKDEKLKKIKAKLNP